jgi:hypothetical protein
VVLVVKFKLLKLNIIQEKVRLGLKTIKEKEISNSNLYFRALKKMMRPRIKSKWKTEKARSTGIVQNQVLHKVQMVED